MAPTQQRCKSAQKESRVQIANSKEGMSGEEEDFKQKVNVI